jgi:signal transduction histidine kinase
MACVAVSFLGATLASEHLENAIARRANDIVGNAMPSVKMLSAARGKLRELEQDIEHAAAGARSRERRERADAARHDIDHALASYVALPFFPDEKSLYAHVSSRLQTLDENRAAYDASHAPELLHTLLNDFAAVDHELERVVDFDAEQGQRLGLEIERLRGQTKGLVALLNGLSVLLALFAVGLALRQLRKEQRERDHQVREREQRETALAEQNEALGLFAGRVAHDILSPLSTVMLSLDLVRQAGGNARTASGALDRGVSAVHRVHALVDGLLAFAKASEHPEPGTGVEVAPVLMDLVDGLTLQADEQRIAVVLGPVPSGAVACSRGVLTSIVANLVRNAIKYMGDSPERRIDVRANVRSDAWIIEVVDTGPGIPHDQHQRIFEPYVQLARGAGIGLGLGTVDRLVRAHGGTVGVESEPGRGSRFWFELPRVRTEAVERASSRATSTVPSSA